MPIYDASDHRAWFFLILKRVPVRSFVSVLVCGRPPWAFDLFYRAQLLREDYQLAKLMSRVLARVNDLLIDWCYTHFRDYGIWPLGLSRFLSDRQERLQATVLEVYLFPIIIQASNRLQ